MPIYEFFCPNCNHTFERLSPLTSQPNVSCERCGLDGQRVMSRFSFRHATTHYQHMQERQEEARYKTDKRMDEDPLLDPTNWLNKVKEERAAEKAFAKEVQSKFGKEPDAPMRYMGELEMSRQISGEGAALES
ncbi:FmdB family zinc ribbon protein [Dehalogenimonas alkenigignens]|uniref:FmdB family zinc ribbon protein n=1 Tax=Dehalogenimonas alkenigignens TaxID=1217799 RepID=UPI000D575DDE|nr:zinc ribbon domain-containing protein [Dehalogenimonas alkenigignens]PVV82621.1 hypothetical protein DD509_08345 [Dehalogenimonas alkenigignens]